MADRLTETELTRFHEDGFVVVRGLADAHRCAALLAVAREHLARDLPPVEYEAQLHYPGAPASLEAPGGFASRACDAM